MRKIYPLGHKSSITLISLKGTKVSSKTAKIIAFLDDKTNIPLKHGIHLAFAASKKKFPKAVDRNKIKRRFRAALHQELKKFQLENNSLLLLIIPNHNSIRIEFTQIKQDIYNLLAQAIC